MVYTCYAVFGLLFNFLVEVATLLTTRRYLPFNYPKRGEVMLVDDVGEGSGFFGLSMTIAHIEPHRDGATDKPHSNV